MIELTQEQQHKLEAAESVVPTNTTYLLIHKDVFERIRGLLGDENWTRDVYQTAMELFAREGWDDPRMDVYDELDPRHPA